MADAELEKQFQAAAERVRQKMSEPGVAATFS